MGDAGLGAGAGTVHGMTIPHGPHVRRQGKLQSADRSAAATIVRTPIGNRIMERVSGFHAVRERSQQSAGDATPRGPGHNSMFQHKFSDFSGLPSARQTAKSTPSVPWH